MGQVSSTSIDKIVSGNTTLETILDQTNFALGSPRLDDDGEINNHTPILKNIDGKAVFVIPTQKNIKYDINGWNCQIKLNEIKRNMDSIINEIKNATQIYEEEETKNDLNNIKDSNKLSTLDSVKQLLTPKSSIFGRKNNKHKKQTKRNDKQTKSFQTNENSKKDVKSIK